MDTYTKPFAWSYSALTNFENCPKKYYEYAVAKNVKEPENDNMRWGYQVHEAMAKRLIYGRELPESMASFEPWARFALTNPSAQTILKTEQKLAITVDGKPCEFFDKVHTPWCRAVLDVLKMRGNVARIIDWKTGKHPKYDDSLDNAKMQLVIGAALTMVHYPKVDTVLCQLIYLQEDTEQSVKNRSEEVHRIDLPHIWRTLAPRVQHMSEAILNSDYPPKPSGLCKKHCAVVACPYHGRSNR